MALDDFADDSSTGSKSIATRKKLKNVTLPENFWNNWLISHPQYASSAAMFADEAAAKAIVQKLDELIEDGARGHSISDQTREELQDERERIVEEVL